MCGFAVIDHRSRGYNFIYDSHLNLAYLEFVLGFQAASAQAQFYSQRRRIYLSTLRRARGRHGGLMVSALYSGASVPGSSPVWGHCVVFWARPFTLTMPLSTQVYKWVPANLMLGGNPVMD